MTNKLATPTADPVAAFDRALLVKGCVAQRDDYLGDFSSALGGTGPAGLPKAIAGQHAKRDTCAPAATRPGEVRGRTPDGEGSPLTPRRQHTMLPPPEIVAATSAARSLALTDQNSSHVSQYASTG